MCLFQKKKLLSIRCFSSAIDILSNINIQDEVNFAVDMRQGEPYDYIIVVSVCIPLFSRKVYVTARMRRLA